MSAAQIAVEENPFFASDERFASLKGRLVSRDLAATSHCELEEILRVEGLELMRLLLQEHLLLRAGRERQAPHLHVVGEDGVARPHRRETERQLTTVFGDVEVERLAYSARGHHSLSPLDGELNLSPDQYSLGVRRRVAEEAARGSFDAVEESLGKTTGAHVPKRQCEQLARRAAEDFDAFYPQRPATPPEATGELLVLTGDGKGIVMRLEDLRPATRKAAEQQRHKMQKRLSSGEKRNRKRMAEVAAVYTVSRFVRTPEEIVRELYSEDDPGTRPARPRPENKRVWASVEKEMEEVLRASFAEGQKRDPEHKKIWVALSDGNPTQLAIYRRLAEEYGVPLVLILDVIHVAEYLWKAVTAFCKAGTKEAEKWVRERLLAILHGKATDVAAGMRRSATLRNLSTKARKAVDRTAGYLLDHSHLLHYDVYLAKGMPIATGVIEGACRHLIADRMDITGARWSLLGAEAVLRLRSIRSSGDFEEYWAFHIEQERRRNHAARFRDAVVPPAVATRRATLRLVP